MVKAKKKLKRWFTILAPKLFKEVPIGETICDAGEEQYLIGRTVETTVTDLTGDIMKMHMKLIFQISDVRGQNCYTVFKGFVLTRDYVRSLIRRKTTRVESIKDYITKDGWHIRVRALTILDGRAKTSQEEAAREIMENVIEKNVKNLTMDELLMKIIDYKLQQEISNEVKKIKKPRNVEIRKIKVIRYGPGIKFGTIEVESKKEAAVS